MEDNPHLFLEDDGDKFLFSRRTAALCKFLGDWATHDHIFILIEPEEEWERTTGLYVFKTNKNYQPLVRYMIENKFPLHLNMAEPSPMDRQAFEATHYNDIETNNFVPEDWIEDRGTAED